MFDNQMLVKLIIPLIIEQFLTVTVGMADSVMIASVGEAAVSGVSLVDTVNILLINVFAAMATGGAVVAGQYLGQKRQKEACKAADQLVLFITFFSIIIMVLMYLCKNWILHGVFGKIDSDVMGYANTYLVIVSLSIPFIALYLSLIHIFPEFPVRYLAIRSSFRQFREGCQNRLTLSSPEIIHTSFRVVQVHQ